MIKSNFLYFFLFQGQVQFTIPVPTTCLPIIPQVQKPKAPERTKPGTDQVEIPTDVVRGSLGLN